MKTSLTTVLSYIFDCFQTDFNNFTISYYKESHCVSSCNFNQFSGISAQSDQVNSQAGYPTLLLPPLTQKKNNKISLTSLALKNFQLHRQSLTKRIGVVIGYSFISKGSVPTHLNDLVSDNSQGIIDKC
jgi:hypothetical protein